MSGRLVRLAGALAITAAAVAVGYVINVTSRTPATYLTFFPAVFLGTWIAGRAGGFLSLGLSLLPALYFLPPADSLSFDHTAGAWLSLAIFGATSVTIIEIQSQRDRLLTAHRAARGRAEALAGMVVDLNAGRSLADVLAAAINHIRALLAADGGALYLFDPDGRQVRRAFAPDAGGQPETVVRLEDWPTSQRAVQERKTVYLRRPDTAGGEAALFARLGVWGSMIMPLIVEGRPLALLALHYQREGYTPPADHVAFAESLAAQAALAIDRAQLQERERAGHGAALREREERLRTTLHSIADGVIATDASGQVVDMNPVAEQLTGWRLSDARGAPLADVFAVINEDSRAAVESPAARVLREGVVVGLANHTALVARDGTERPIADSGAPIRDAEGHVRGVVLVFRDMTEERRAEQAERRLNRALRTLSQCNEVLVRATDERELLQAVCRTVVDTAGYRMAWVGFAERDERRTIRPVAQAGFEDGYLESVTITWADDEHGRGPTGRAVRTGTPVVARNLRTEPDYEPWRAEALRRGFASSAALPLLLAGEVLGALTLYAPEAEAFDDAEMKLLGELADDLAFGLATLRARAERERMQAQLLFADRMASMGQLASGVAHEVNNPLAYVITSLDLMAQDLPRLTAAGPAGSAGDALCAHAERLAQARDGAERVRLIVRDLKTFSRADDETIGRVDLGRVLDAAISMAANEIKHRATLVRDYRALPAVMGNEARLGQVFLNLLTNAAQAIPEGQAAHNEIRVVGASDPAGRVSVEIHDTGEGIASEHLGRIFDPFFTTKPIGVGTGLGLPICHGIVTAMGGDITVQTTPGHGSVFRVSLPATSAAPAPVEAPRAPPPPAPSYPGRILVIDDEETIGAAMCAVLADYAVVATTQASQALALLEQGEEFDLIFCDLMMPDMTGMDFHARLAARAPAAADRIVFMSGGAFTQRSREFLSGVPNPRLEKPFDLRRLRALTRDRLAALRGGAAPDR
ncbi:MAG TPA: GAF domain-containing protein [Polyangia bacterium]|jgi:PAS domain S-box-containing protein